MRPFAARERRGCRSLSERLADAPARLRLVELPVELADEFAAVLVSEALRDVRGVEPEHVPGAPGEMVAGGGVEVDIAETRPQRTRFQ